MRYPLPYAFARTAGLLLEDGMRLLGVLTFTHYLILTTIDITRSVVDDTRR